MSAFVCTHFGAEIESETISFEGMISAWRNRVNMRRKHPMNDHRERQMESQNTYHHCSSDDDKDRRSIAGGCVVWDAYRLHVHHDIADFSGFWNTRPLSKVMFSADEKGIEREENHVACFARGQIVL